MEKYRWTQRLLAVMVVFLVGGILCLSNTCAFNGRDLALINIALPAVQAGLRAHRNRNPVGPAILQAISGGMMMQKAFELASRVDDQSVWKAWQAKILLNLRASLAESAGDRFKYRMDMGPVWLIADSQGIKFKLGVHGTLAPFLNMSDGARIDLKRSLRFGTLALRREQRQDGTIGDNGALAYSNANNFITDPYGNHVGHELIHTFQYRRDAFSCPKTRLPMNFVTLVAVRGL